MQIVLFSLRWDKKVGHLQWYFLSVVRAYFMRFKVWQNFGAVLYQYHAGLINYFSLISMVENAWFSICNAMFAL